MVKYVLVSINISIFRYNPPKNFVGLLVTQKIFIITFGPYFLVKTSYFFFIEIIQKLIKYYDNLSKKNY